MLLIYRSAGSTREMQIKVLPKGESGQISAKGRVHTYIICDTLTYGQERKKMVKKIFFYCKRDQELQKA